MLLEPLQRAPPKPFRWKSDTSSNEIDASSLASHCNCLVLSCQCPAFKTVYLRAREKVLIHDLTAKHKGLFAAPHPPSDALGIGGVRPSFLFPPPICSASTASLWLLCRCPPLKLHAPQTSMFGPLLPTPCRPPEHFHQLPAAGPPATVSLNNSKQ